MIHRLRRFAQMKHDGLRVFPNCGNRGNLWIPSSGLPRRFTLFLLCVSAFTSTRCEMNQQTKTPAAAQAATSGPVTSAAGYDVTPLGEAEVNELAKSLSPDERQVMLYQGTEAPFCGNLLANKKHGTYVCRLCALPLFKSGSKFESGTGWPSFYEPYDRDHVANIVDRSHGMTRTEIRCARCGGHLGHVFPDGPPPTGERYCLNSASLEFVEQGKGIQPRVESDRGKTGAPPTKTEGERKSAPIREP